MDANDIGRRASFYHYEVIIGTTQYVGTHTHKTTIFSTSETETRPVNATVVYVIKL